MLENTIFVRNRPVYAYDVNYASAFYKNTEYIRSIPLFKSSITIRRTEAQELFKNYTQNRKLLNFLFVGSLAGNIQRKLWWDILVTRTYPTIHLRG
jgi:hypothetical protein